MRFSKTFGIYNPIHKALLLGFDLIGLILAFALASHVRLNASPDYYSVEFFGVCFIFICGLFIGNGYTSRGTIDGPKLPLNSFLVVLASAVVCLIFIYSLGPNRFTNLFGRGVFPVAILVFGVFAVVNRSVLNALFRRKSNPKTVLILSDQKKDYQFKQSQPTIYASKLSINNHLTKSLDAIVLTPEHLPSKSEQKALIEFRLAGIPIFTLSDFREQREYLVPVQEIDDSWFLKSEGFTMVHSRASLRLKRTLDMIVTVPLLILGLPLIFVAALLIKLTSKGPVFFSQTRVGKEGHNFTIFKLRTMQQNSEKDGAIWAEKNDQRVTFIGRVLRKTRIDELPQCWNILKGEMSIIGPRPERPEFTKMLSREIPYYDLRHIVKPGLTGWAQVNYPYGASVEDALKKLQYDLYYIKNYSLLLDINILLRTVLVMLHLKGR